MGAEKAPGLPELPGRHDGPGSRRQRLRRARGTPLAEALALSRVFESAAELARAAADEFFRRGCEAIERRGRFTVALSGGGTPRETHAAIASRRSEIDWSAVHFFWGDERTVPPDDSQSNYRMASETLLSLLPIAPGNVHRWLSERDPREAAAAYGEELEAILGDVGLDLVYLGLGDDGHTASLFPGTSALGVRDGRTAANWVPALDRWRLTLTYPALDAARAALFLVEGEGKASVVRRLKDGEDLPASRVRAAETIWFLDRAAAGNSIS